MSDEKPKGSPSAEEAAEWLSNILKQLAKTADVLETFSLRLREATERGLVLQALLEEKGVLAEGEVEQKRQVLKDVVRLGRELGDNPKPEAGG